jgi:hypothetical protein
VLALHGNLQTRFASFGQSVYVKAYLPQQVQMPIKGNALGKVVRLQL